MASKYPGFSILYEIGSRAAIAKSYGVSERTVYRWLSKASKETGLKTLPYSKYPGAKKIAKFKGTRAQLAKKYGISERTAYRWINKARAEGAAPESRIRKSKYPGEGILSEEGTNKELAAKFGVSPRTIQRWKQKANKEIAAPEQLEAPEPEPIQEPPTPEDEQERFEEEFYQEPEEVSDDKEELLKNIINILLDNPYLVSENSIFRDLLPEEQQQYLDAYIQYQYDMDEHQFYDPETHTMSFDPDFVSNINIWGDEFEEWVNKQFSSDMYEVL